MIDWVTCKIPFIHQPIKGLVINKFDEESGEVVTSIKVGRQCEGSYSSKVAVFSSGCHDENHAAFLHISGNPAKFLQGHNVCGSDDLLSLVYDTVKELDKLLDLRIDEFTWHVIKIGRYNITRIDINQSYTLRDQAEVQAWLRAAEFKASSRSGRASNKHGTVYINKNSTRWSVKYYSKHHELSKGGKEHRLPENLLATNLLGWCENVLRCELTLRGPELIRNEFEYASDIASKVDWLFREYMGRVRMTESYKLPDRETFELPKPVLCTYTLWTQGYDVKHMMPKNTFYRHRRILLALGVDINLACEFVEQGDNVVPLLRALEAVPAQIPDEFIEQGLIHHSIFNEVYK